MAANDDDKAKLELDLSQWKEAAEGATEQLEQKFKPAIDKAAKSGVNLGQTALQAGRFLQDFAQGGVGGVLNNIEGLSVALGGGPGLAGVMTAVGLAAYFALPKMKEWWNAVFEGSNKLPEATKGLEGLRKEIAANAKELDSLREKHILTNKELVRFNELTAKQTELTAKQTEAEQKRATLQAARSIAAGNEETAKYGAAFRKSAAESGGSEQLLNDLVALGMDEGSAASLIEQAMGGSKSAIAKISRTTAPLGNRAFGNFFARNDPETVAMEQRAQAGMKAMREREKKLKAEREKAAEEEGVSQQHIRQFNAQVADEFARRDQAARLPAGVPRRGQNLGQISDLIQQGVRPSQIEAGLRGGMSTGQMQQVQNLQRQMMQAMSGNQTVQQSMMQALRDIQARNRQLNAMARGTVQSGQSAMNMGAP